MSPFTTRLLSGEPHARGDEGDDEAIARLARRQHGVVARWQLLELGLSEKAVDHRVARGRLRRLYPGVYAVGHDALGYPGRALAAVLSAGRGAAVSHVSAAALWRLCEPPNGAVHVTVNRPVAHGTG